MEQNTSEILYLQFFLIINCSARIKCNNVGPPPTSIGSSILFSDYYGGTGHWSSSDNGNNFSISGFNSNLSGCLKIEAYIYRLDSNYNPTQQVWHGTNLGFTNVTVPTFSTGWYLVKVRGYNDCGYSDWLEEEVEVIDLSRLNFQLDYDSSAEDLTIIIVEPNTTDSSNNTKSHTSGMHEIQLLNSTSTAMIKRYKTDLYSFKF